MTKLYVLAGTPGSGTDFFANQIWAHGTHWAKNPPIPYKKEVEQSLTQGPSINNNYVFNLIQHAGLNDRNYKNRLITNDDRFDGIDGIPANVRIVNLSQQQRDDIWKEIERVFGDNNILTSTSCPAFEYVWSNTVYTHVVTGPITSDLTRAMSVIKTNNLYDDDKIFKKYSVEDPVIKAYLNMDKLNINKIAKHHFERKGKVTMWELLELKYHSYPSNMVLPKPIPNPALWLEYKLYNTPVITKFKQNQEPIQLDLIYKKDKDELAKLFKSFDVDEFNEQTVWDYVDRDLELFNTINKNNNWQQEIVDYITERIK